MKTLRALRNLFESAWLLLIHPPTVKAEDGTRAPMSVWDVLRDVVTILRRTGWVEEWQ